MSLFTTLLAFIVNISSGFKKWCSRNTVFLMFLCECDVAFGNHTMHHAYDTISLAISHLAFSVNLVQRRVKVRCSIVLLIIVGTKFWL